MAIDDKNVPNVNSSKNLDAEGKPLYPSTYEFEEIRMIKDVNGFREGIDIQKIVTSFTVVEELFSPFLTARIRIRDNENFFEDFNLDGREIINVKIKYLKNTDSEQPIYETLEHQFVIRDYPTFAKTEESVNLQVYDINLVSAWAYLSRLQQISESVNGNPVKIIEDFFKRYLGNPEFNYLSEERAPCKVDNFKGVITLRTPLQAIEWLRTICYDDVFKSPYFIYTTLKDNTIFAQSYGDILSDEGNKVYNPFEESGGEEKPYSITSAGIGRPGTPEYLKELKTKIISLKSNIKLDKLTQAVGGGLGGVTEVIDFGERTYLKEITNFKKPEVSIKQQRKNRRRNRRNNDSTAGIGLRNLGTQNFNFSQEGDEIFDFKFLENVIINGSRPEILDTILEDPRISQDVYYIPADPYKGEFKGTAEIKKQALRDTKLYMANMESMSHSIIVYGDPNLKAGAKIEIQVPKAIDTNADDPKSTGGRQRNSSLFDENISGKYIIAVSTHTFETGVYTNQLNIVRDHFNNA